MIEQRQDQMTFKNFFDAARVIAGGKLTQAQVYDLNKVVDKLAPSGMTTSDVGVDLISGFEDTRFKAYDDGEGVWTMGTGTTVYPNGVKVRQGDTCTPEQAKAYFKYDLTKFEKTVNNSVTVPLTQNQFDAMVSLTYNIGSDAFHNSNLRKLLNKGDYQGAANQFLVWNKAGGKVMKGLVRRREAERPLF